MDDELPSLQASMTPWRRRAAEVGASSSATEIEQLQAQLTTYKLKVQSLYELLRRSQGDLLCQQFDRKLSLGDDALHRKIESLELQLERTKNEHLATLDVADEYLKHSEELAAKLDQILAVIISNANLSQDDIDSLEHCKQMPGDYVNVKIDTVLSIISKILTTNETAVMANSTGIHDNLDNTHLDIVVDQLHEQYEAFIQSLSSKIDAISSMESQLGSKLVEQLQILKILSKRIQSSTRLEKALESEKKLSQFKENNWDEMTETLQEELAHLQHSNTELSHLMKLMSAENTKLGETNDALQKKLITVTKNMGFLKQKNDTLNKIVHSLQNSNTDFHIFSNDLVLHLQQMFTTLSKILQQRSIDQSQKKLDHISTMTDLQQINSLQNKLKPLYNFVETALESIVESYTAIVTTERKQDTHASQQLRIEELEKKLLSQRERYDLDLATAESRIRKLEQENEDLRDQLYNMTIRR